MAGYATPFGSGASNSGDPIAELDAWTQYRHQFEQQYGQHAASAPQAAIDQYNGKNLSPQAWQLYKTGNGSQHYDITQGDQGGLANNKGWLSHPESWIQLGLGAGIGGIGAASALGGAAGSAAGSGASAGAASGELGIPTTMGIGSATSLGLPVTEGLGSAGGALSGLAGAAGAAQGYPGSDGYAGGNSFPNGIPEGASGLASLLTDPKWSPLIKALAGVGGLLGGKALANQGQANAVPPQLNQLLDLSMQRANAQTPLFNAANKGLYDMLPDFAKKGGG